MPIPSRFIEELKNQLTLSDIVGRSVSITRAGREFKGCCPFHNEKTPSFYVNDEKQFYHCFGCGAHGTAIDFVMQTQNLSFPEAVEILASEAGLQVPQQSPQDIRRAREEKDLYSLMEEATRWMELQLREPSNRKAYNYMLNRGMSDDHMHAFRIGYAPADGQAIRKYLLGQGFKDKQMIEVGILRFSNKGGDPYAFFREQIMFPVADKRGRVIAFGGRILPDHLRPPDRGDYKPPKYINSPETPLFDKGRTLYGESHARQAASEDKPIVVVEGYVDVIACFKAGYTGAVAPLGTALTEEQILRLWKIIPNSSKVPILCFDGDNAGRRAAARAVERLLPVLKADHSARIVLLPEGQDPDDLVNSQGPSALSALLESAMPLVDFIWLHHTQGKQFKTPEERAGLSKALEAEAAKIADKNVQHYYRQALREKISDVFRSLNQNKYGNSSLKNNTAKNFLPVRSPAFSKLRVIECALLAAIINHPDIFEDVEEDLGRISFSEKGLDVLRQSILVKLSASEGLDANIFHDHLISSGYEGELNAVLCESTYIHASFARPKSELNEVLEGWKTAFKILDNALEKL